MIIGINGKIGSGKDSFAALFRYLTAPGKEENFKKSFNMLVHYGVAMMNMTKSPWEVKKFAGKLKQIASLLTGIPVEKWEDQEFKKEYMGDEWGMTYREFLQKLGTEAMRDGLHQNVWCMSLFSDYVDGDLETWKDVAGYEGCYKISSFGNVMRLKRRSIYGEIEKGEYHDYDNLILKQTPSNGYNTVKLLNKETFTVHSLVANHFVENPHNHKYINHIDQNKTNNFYKNLEWCTQSHNIISANKNGNGCFGENNGHSKLNYEKVSEIRKILSEGKMSQLKIASLYGVCPTTITDIKKNRKWVTHLAVEKVQPIVPQKSPLWLITDVRYKNEADAIKKRGGMIIRIERPNSDMPVSNHPSETSLDDYTFDEIILNDGTLLDLQNKVETFINKHNLWQAVK